MAHDYEAPDNTHLSRIHQAIAGENGERDAFSRWRVSNPTTLFDSQSQYNEGLTDKWFHKTTTGGSSSHSADQASSMMVTTSGASASIIRQTQRYLRYQPGKSQLVFVTFDFSANDGGTKRAGYFDGDNGFFVEMDTKGRVTMNRRSKASGSVVDYSIKQKDWNADVMGPPSSPAVPPDAPNPSGITLDITKPQILVIDLQWLATGTVRAGFDIDGEIHYCHRFRWANLAASSGVYMTTANLPVRYELIGNGNVTALQAICASVQSEGGFIADLGHEHVTPNGITPVACADGATTPLITIRPKTTFNSIANRGEYIPTGISFYIETNPALIRMYHGATLTGSPSWTSSDAESGIEFDVAASGITGGHLTNSEFGAAAGGGKAFSTAGGAESTDKIFLTLDIDGANHDGGNFTVVGVGLGGSASVYCNVHWAEIK
jgi:hypothetical protein